MSTFYSNGKLLITAEYLVLDGANAFAIPTKLGQSLTVNRNDDSKIYWKSIDDKGNLWFDSIFELANNKIHLLDNMDEISNRLLEVLTAAQSLNTNFLINNEGITVKTKLDFPRDWGLGTSSTLINNIAQWAKIDPYKLLGQTFGGSGYDIACAQTDSPITYKLEKNRPVIYKVNFTPPFIDELYFVYLNKKQNSREGIAYYKSNRKNIKTAIDEVNDITSKLVLCQDLKEFEKLITSHETIIGKVTNQIPVKELFFKDFKGSIKSLGAWGGDFVLVTSKENPKDYFKSKGFNTVLKYSDLIKS